MRSNVGEHCLGTMLCSSRGVSKDVGDAFACPENALSFFSAIAILPLKSSLKYLADRFLRGFAKICKSRSTMKYSHPQRHPHLHPVSAPAPLPPPLSFITSWKEEYAGLVFCMKLICILYASPLCHYLITSSCIPAHPMHPIP